MVLNNYPRNFRNLSFSLYYFIPCLLARFFKILIWRFHQIAHSSSSISMAQTFIRESYDLKFIFRIGKILESRVVIQLISVISLSLSFAIIGQYSIVDAGSSMDWESWRGWREQRAWEFILEPTTPCTHRGLESRLPRVYPRDFWILASRIARYEAMAAFRTAAIDIGQPGNQLSDSLSLLCTRFYN